jgi:branched-chain amino acid transport system permease protein
MIIPTIWMSAIVYACLISILSIGFTLTYMTAKIPNFAHGTYAGIGIYVVYTISKILGYSPYIGFPIAFVVGGIISVIIFKLIISVLAKMGRGTIVITISTLAIQILLTAALYVYAYWLRSIYKTYALGFLLKDADFKFGGYQGIFPVSVLICVVTVISLHYMLTRTKVGIAMRATAESPELASVLGINTDRIQMMSWFLTGGLACLAGAMLPLWFMSRPDTGSLIITSIMAGSMLGGLNTIYGAIIGGLGVGLSEILVTTWAQNIRINGVRQLWVGEYRPLIPMIIMIAVLLIEPEGLGGLFARLRASDVWRKASSIYKREENGEN